MWQKIPAAYTRRTHFLNKKPESTYLGYISPTSGSSKCIEGTLVDFLIDAKISTDSLIAIGCDGTNVNVGKHFMW